MLALSRRATGLLGAPVVASREDIVDGAAIETGIGTQPVALAWRRGAVSNLVLDAAVLTRAAEGLAG
jgi:LDH2 family malate/lactate/ureidoglycolate dehydrogenase